MGDPQSAFEITWGILLYALLFISLYGMFLFSIWGIKNILSTVRSYYRLWIKR